MTIRKVTSEDIDWIVDIGIKDMFNILGKPEYYNNKYLKTVFIPFLLETGICLIKEKEGVFLGMVDQHPLNPDLLIAQELMWWVTKEKRGSPLGYRLLKEFEKEAKIFGASVISIGLMEKTPVKHISKLGYTRSETSFVKDI